MNLDTFTALSAQGYNRIPVVKTLTADLETPLSVYLKLANRPYSCLLESVQGGERFGRYSYIGLPATTRLTVHGRRVVVETPAGTQSYDDIDPLSFIDTYSTQFKAAPLPNLPRFNGGLIGYFGYETIHHIEPRVAKGTHPDVIGTPDMLFMLCEELVVVDNLAGKLHLVVYADTAEANALDNAQSRLAELAQQLQQAAHAPATPVCTAHVEKSEFGEQAFKDAVLKAKQYILDGDIMQVVLSQRMSRRFEAHPLTLYRALRSLNPSPYLFYFDMDNFHIVGSSPEILVRREADLVTVRPIAGTRPRGKTRVEDLALEKELLADPKECAEHVQLMDLGRNDAGRVAVTGSVKVTENMTIERYSHVMHIVSSVEAKLKPGLSNIDILRATFPAGTVSGAPKVRAMEIINELEPVKRGIYSGAVGFLGFNGDMDLAIAIRTAVVKDQTLYVQAGAGIVADSVPQSEWDETRNKARAVLRAAELADLGLEG